MIRIELAALALAGFVLAFPGCRSSAAAPPPAPDASAPAAAAAPAQPWAVAGFRDDEDWRALSPAPDANEMPMPQPKSRQASAGAPTSRSSLSDRGPRHASRAPVP